MECSESVGTDTVMQVVRLPRVVNTVEFRRDSGQISTLAQRLVLDLDSSQNVEKTVFKFIRENCFETDTIEATFTNGSAQLWIEDGVITGRIIEDEKEVKVPDERLVIEPPKSTPIYERGAFWWAILILVALFFVYKIVQKR